MIVIIIIGSCRKEFSKTGDSTIIKNIVYQNHFIKSKCVFKVFPVKLFKELRGVGINNLVPSTPLQLYFGISVVFLLVQFRNYPTEGSNNQSMAELKPYR